MKDIVDRQLIGSRNELLSFCVILLLGSELVDLVIGYGGLGQCGLKWV